MEYQVQKAALNGDWKTVCKGNENYAREIYARQLKLYSIGRFRLLDPNNNVLEEAKAIPLFSNN